MAAVQKVTADLGSDEVRLLREQVNRLTRDLELLQAGTVATALDVTDYVEIAPEPNVPRPRRIPSV